MTKSISFYGKGWSLLFQFIRTGFFLILAIPYAYGLELFWKYIINNIEIEDYGRLNFTGKAKDIFLPSIIYSICTFHIYIILSAFSASETGPNEVVIYICFLILLPFLLWSVIEFVKWIKSNTSLPFFATFEFYGDYPSILGRTYIMYLIPFLGLLIASFILASVDLSINDLYDDTNLTNSQSVAILFAALIRLITSLGSFVFLLIVFGPWLIKNIKIKGVKFRLKTPIINFFVNFVIAYLKACLFFILIVTIPKAISELFNWFFSSFVIEVEEEIS